jgi:hypothetical protein
MIVDLKNIRIYLISPGYGKYRDRLITTFTRLVDEGYKNIIFFKSIPGPNGTASLTHTVMEIFKTEINNTEPFIILEDDVAFFTKYDTLELPDNWDMLYLGVSLWTYNHPIETLYSPVRPNITRNNSNVIQNYNDTLVKVKGMTSTHAILYHSREYMKMCIEKMNEISKVYDSLPHDLLFSVLNATFQVFALKNPMFYQDSHLGGQEDVTKVTYNGDGFR